MKLLNIITFGIVAMAGLQPGLSMAAAATTGTVVESGAPVAVAEINGDVVTDDELTSFASELQQAGQRGATLGEELLNRYILTKLYEKIPTTATISEAGSKDSSPSQYELVTQRSLLKRDLREQISEGLDIPRSEMEAWYKENIDKYTKPERVHAMHLFMETSDDNPSSSPQQVRARLTELKAQIDSGTSFSQVAREHSEAASAESGGEIGSITRRMPIGPLSKPMNLELETAFFALEPGMVSDVVDTRHGMHLLYISDRQTTVTPSLDDLITSGILPGALAQDHLTSALTALVADTTEKYNGTVLPGGVPDEGVTSDSVAFKLDGKSYTIANLISLFGPRFESYLDSVKADENALTGLMKQAMEDEAMILAAIDMGVDKSPENVRDLKVLGEIELAEKRIDAIATAEAAVSELDVLAKYNSLRDELRQPEAEGMLLVVQSEQSTGTAEQARAIETAQEAANAIHERLKTENFKAVAEEIIAAGDIKTTMTEMPKHIIGRSTVPLSRIFDQAISSMRDQSGLSPVVPVGSDFAIARLEQRYPGEAVPLAQVRGRIVSMLEQQAEGDVRGQLVQRLEKLGLVEYLPGAEKYGKQVGTDVTDAATTGTVQ